MAESHFEQTFKAVSPEEVPQGEYESCVFQQCHWPEATLAGYTFIDCTFEGCDLSLVKLYDTGLQGVRFVQCKLQGLALTDAKAFLMEVSFDRCQLRLANFYRCVLKKTAFKACQLTEVDFSEADLAGARFAECDLSGATFDQTHLEKADFRTAVGYTLAPDRNFVKQAKFSTDGLPGLLQAYDLVMEG